MTTHGLEVSRKECVSPNNLRFNMSTKTLFSYASKLTEPIARKNENVAALLSMYCESVARKPLGPAPCLGVPRILSRMVSRGT